MVLDAPRMRAKRTSTPASLRPQKALQKSRERFCGIGECALAYFESEVVEGWRRVDIFREGRRHQADWFVTDLHTQSCNIQCIITGAS